MKKDFPFYKQLDGMDCGPTCLRIIAKYYGLSIGSDEIKERSFIGRDGTSFAGLSEAAESIGFHTLALSVNFQSLKDEIPLPCIAHWRQKHFVVVYNIDKKHVYVSDPAFGLIQYTHSEFLKSWLPQKTQNSESQGIILALEKTADFNTELTEDTSTTPNYLGFILKYFKPHSKNIALLFLSLFIGTLLMLIFPFLTQALVDKGVMLNDFNIIYLILIAQITLFISGTFVDIIRSWILLYITSRVNISIVSDFIGKLMRLPISFFDSKNIGDLVNRVTDHQRVSNLLSAHSLSVLFGLVNIIVFSFVMAYFKLSIFIVFIIGTFLYALWVMLFLKKKAALDYKIFDQSSDNQSSFIQLVNGMQEIKLNNSEKKRRWEWEGIQIKLFRLSTKSLSLSQLQTNGGIFINECKNITITFLSAKAVIDGQLTLGGMLSIQYILGQLNAPINNFIIFIQTAQNAFISIQRLSEIHGKSDEDDRRELKVVELKTDRTIRLANLHFRYGASSMPLVLKDINLSIEHGKVTAIVGESGCGKTTLLKILLKFYVPTEGDVYVGPTPLKNFNTRFWRSNCGIVMQDGFIFGDTIAKNIAESETETSINREKLEHATAVANLTDFIENLPMGYNTKIGPIGMNISGGQKQRILIARAVYKNPEFIFFDEATSSLDANNEKIVMRNLEKFYKGKTVVIVAHRLSTLKNADRIIVLEKGSIAEEGTHQQLVTKRGAYYTLVKNQLELGN